MPDPGTVLGLGPLLGFLLVVVVGLLASVLCAPEWMRWSRSDRFPGLSFQTWRRLMRGEFDAELPRHRKARRVYLWVVILAGVATVTTFIVALIAQIIG